MPPLPFRRLSQVLGVAAVLAGAGAHGADRPRGAAPKTSAARPALPPVAPPAPAVPGAPTSGTLTLAPAPVQTGIPGATSIVWWGHAAFVLTTPTGTALAIDPWLDNPSAPRNIARPIILDAILVTHGHLDHVGNTAQLAKNTRANVIAPSELAGLIGAESSSAVTPGGTVQVKDLAVHVVEAVHGSGYNPDPKQDPKNTLYAGVAVGFVVTIPKGPAIYFAGDTDVFSSMTLIAERYHPTIAVLPIGGSFTMDPAGAALAAKLLKVKTVIPMHYGTFPLLTGTPAELRAELKKQHGAAKVLELKIGETTKL